MLEWQLTCQSWSELEMMFLCRCILRASGGFIAHVDNGKSSDSCQREAEVRKEVLEFWERKNLLFQMYYVSNKLHYLIYWLTWVPHSQVKSSRVRRSITMASLGLLGIQRVSSWCLVLKPKFQRILFLPWTKHQGLSNLNKNKRISTVSGGHNFWKKVYNLFIVFTPFPNKLQNTRSCSTSGCFSIK